MENIAVTMLALIEQYEAVPRAVLAKNVRNAMAQLGLTERGECLWLAKLFNTTRNTTYSWLAPNRYAKVPLKVVVKLAITLDIPLERLLDTSIKRTNEQLRRKKERSNYKEDVLDCAKAHPEWSIKQIASELEICAETVRRHLKLSKEK